MSFPRPLPIKQLLQHKTKHEAQAPILSTALQVVIHKPHSDLNLFHWFGITKVATPGRDQASRAAHATRLSEMLCALSRHHPALLSGSTWVLPRRTTLALPWLPKRSPSNLQLSQTYLAPTDLSNAPWVPSAMVLQFHCRTGPSTLLAVASREVP